MRILALSAVLILTSVQSAQAAKPGTLDREFGRDGRIETPVAGGIPTVAGVESVANSKTLLVGTVGDRKLVLIRYRRDGRLDRRFSGDGVRAFTFHRDVTAVDTLLDGDGRLLVAGSLGEFDSPDRAALLVRFTRAGYLDPDLDQDGISLTDFGGTKGDGATAIALTPGGQIVVAASLHPGEGGHLGVARLDQDGAVDAGFGNHGFVRMEPHFSFDSYSASAVGVETDGRIALAVNVGSPKGGASYVVKLLPDGRPDSGFGGPYDLPGWRGIGGPDTDADTRFVATLVVDNAADRILLAGTACPIYCEYFSPWVTTTGDSAPWGGLIKADTRGAYGRALVLDRAGRAVVLGASTFRAVPTRGALRRSREYAYMLVARVGANGTLDPCFGRRGIARVWFRNRLSKPAGLTISPGGDIVIAGPDAYGGETTPRRFQLARLQGGTCGGR